MAYISSPAVLHLKSSPSPSKNLYSICIWSLQRTVPQKKKQKHGQVSETRWLGSPHTTEPNRLESNYKNTHLAFALKKALAYFISSFWHRNLHIWHKAHAHFVINLYYSFIKMFKILWWCKHNILYQATACHFYL